MFIYYTHILKYNDIEYPKPLFLDDAHISTINLINKEDVFYPIIGRASIQPSINSYLNPDLPDPLKNLQSAHYHSLAGNNSYFINYKLIPKKQRLNHTWFHLKLFYSNKKIGYFDKNNPYNWHVKLYNTDTIYESKPLCTINYIFAYNSLKSMFEYINHKHIAVLPFNEINDKIIYVAEKLDIRYLVYNDIFDVKNSKTLNIKRICLDKMTKEEILNLKSYTLKDLF